MPHDSRLLELVETEADEMIDAGTLDEIEGVLADALFEAWLMEHQGAGQMPAGQTA
jgi:hypothetical protein